MLDLATTNRSKPKLAELRARTDRQLVVLIHRNLDRALAFYDGPRAQRAEAEASALLARVERVTHEERARLEAKLARLRKILEERPAETARAACF